MKKTTYFSLFLVLSVCFLTSCSSNEDVNETPKSNNKDIFSFTFTIDQVNIPVDFDKTNLSIVLPALSDVTKLVPTIEYSSKATIEPKSGEAQDFTNPIMYTVTAEDGSKKEYLVTVSLLDPSADTSIISLGFKNLAEGQSSYLLYDRVSTDIDSLVYKVPYLSPIKELISDIYIQKSATIVPVSGEKLDYSEPVKYTVTAQNGDTQEYLIFVDNNLDQVRVGGLNLDSFRDKKPGDLIRFNVSEINPILDSIKVNLVDRLTQTKIALQVQDAKEINAWTNTITAKLPDTYANNSYQLEVSIEHDNIGISDGFRLDKGTPNFVQINPNYFNVENISVTNLISPGSYFDAKIYIDDSRFDAYKFYVRQNGVEYSLPVTSRNDHFATVHFKMNDDLNGLGATTGTDYQIIIEIDGVKYDFPLVNDKNEAINVIAAAAPMITGVDKTTVVKGETITVTGEHLYYDSPAIGGPMMDTSKLNLSDPENADLIFDIEATSNSSNQITFTIPDQIQSGTYELSFQNNLGTYMATGTITFLITVELPASEHPTIAVTEAVLYLNSTKPLYKQVRISFNENIETTNIENFLLDIDNLEVGNFFITPTSVLTGQLPDTNIGRILDYKDGSITIDGYKIPFTLEVRR